MKMDENEEFPEVTYEEKIAAAEEYLLAKKIVLWSGYDVVHPDTRRKAAVWLVKTFEEFDEVYPRGSGGCFYCC